MSRRIARGELDGAQRNSGDKPNQQACAAPSPAENGAGAAVLLALVVTHSRDRRSSATRRR